MRNATLSYDSEAYAKVNHLDMHHPRAVASAFPEIAGKKVLEVGCGRGFLVEMMQRAGANAWGVDANPQAISGGRTSQLQAADASELPFADDSFDAVISVHTIEHLQDLSRGLAEMARVLRPGGRLLLIYPAEPIMGLWAVPTALILHRNPFKARQVHCQKLTPKRLRGHLAGFPLDHAYSDFSWRGWPQFTSVFDARA